jgi:hypothetical protein
VKPREKGYSRKWNMEKNFPGGLYLVSTSTNFVVSVDLHEHVVTKETCNHRVMHNRLVRLVLEVRLPTLGEVRRRPPLKVLELLLGRSDLDTSLNAVCSKRPSTLLMPFIKYALFISLV